MLAFFQQILAFANFEVLEPNWRKLEGRLEAGKVETVDQLLRDHVDFLDACLKECMLTSSKLLRVHISGFVIESLLRFTRRSSPGILPTDRDLLDICVVRVVVYQVCESSYGYEATEIMFVQR